MREWIGLDAIKPFSRIAASHPPDGQDERSGPRAAAQYARDFLPNTSPRWENFTNLPNRQQVIAKQRVIL